MRKYLIIVAMLLALFLAQAGIVAGLAGEAPSVAGPSDGGVLFHLLI